MLRVLAAHVGPDAGPGAAPETGQILRDLDRALRRRQKVQDERHVRMGMSSKKFTFEGPQTLLSPMPGKVVKVLVEVGATVEDGQPLVLIEAMKMENELRSPKSGKVSAVYVAPGQAVEARTKLVCVD